MNYKYKNCNGTRIEICATEDENLHIWDNDDYIILNNTMIYYFMTLLGYS
jgi:hypothetical protein